MIIRNSGVPMTMRSFRETSTHKWKLAIIAIAVLLQVHLGVGYLFGQSTKNPQTETVTRQENTARLGNTGTRMVGRSALPLTSGVLT